MKYCKKHGKLFRENIFQINKIQLCNVCLTKNGQICKTHGMLNMDEIYVSPDGYNYCNLCRKVKSINQTENRKKDTEYKKRVAKKARDKYQALKKMNK